MKRLLIVTTVPATLSAFLLPFARHFREQGWQVDAMTRGGAVRPEVAMAFDHVWPVDWSRSPLSPQNLVRTPRVVRQIVRRERYDLIHVHTAVAGFVTRYALRSVRGRDGPKVIYTAHGFNFGQGNPFHKNVAFLGLEKLAGRWTDYQVVINRQDEAAARRHRIVPPDRVCYMPGIGLDLGFYKAESVTASAVERVRLDLGLASADQLLLVVAELIPRKRHADALRAFARLVGRNAHMALAGEGPLLEPLRQLAAELNIHDRVHFLGFRRDIPALMCASSALVLPSCAEGLPRSVMEAQSLEVPVIGTDIRGVRDLLADGRGLMFKVGDVGGLAHAMAWVLRHPGEARAMAQRGRAQIATYDLRRVIALHDELYAKAL
ncbi:glycosyltransferase family 4 protein [Oscillochloris sp. ZM17-4]|uniref:glycosyltransferase family 4 protein n=1 Tax=Oscillochloris sp. ZM17-4 TaxID=2866714 RepID=UPI001C7322B4|nr:glycosyltransferase family 4 protein [Oscillochloris sp. ZM17-4]MBX0331334.1 glycosyltransferase family 4 protein [Oscillochloris sp. ZM17-4]